MLDNEIKTNTVWKNYLGWGSTHSKRESFEELYRAYNQISTNSVLTYGDLLPTKKDDELYEDIKALSASNDTYTYKESSFKSFPLVKKYTQLQLTKVSNNCDHAFIVADEDGNQLKNIIPWDFSDTGLYVYTLEDYQGNEIVWGTCDWRLDTNSSILTFSNGVPENVSASNPPKLTFYQYVGPVGERHYVDAILLDVENVTIENGASFVTFTDSAKTVLDNISENFYDTYKFNGSDTTQGIGLQFETLSNVLESDTQDPIKGYDDNSNAQVVSLLSHKKGSCSTEGVTCAFVSENLSGSYTVQITEANTYTKIDFDDGFLVVSATTEGTYAISVSESDDISAALLVKDNTTGAYELYSARSQMSVTLKVPVFVDLMQLPPHLKLSSLASYSDHITPQYYGPRESDFVVASDGTSTEYRSADFVVYNKTGFYLIDAISAASGKDIHLRNGTYQTGSNCVVSYVLKGESNTQTVIEGDLTLEEGAVLKNVIVNGTVTAESSATIVDCKITKIAAPLATVKDTTATDITCANAFSCNCENFTVPDNSNLFSCNITDTFTVSSSSSLFQIYSSYINKLNVADCSSSSVITSSNVAEVVNLPITIKFDATYQTKFDDGVERTSYPDETSIPYYVSFGKRVYAKMPHPFYYSSDDNSLHLKLDTIENTIFLNENGELQCRFFTSKEISMVSTPTTQIENVYSEHADTVLSTDKPTNVDEAIVDLYWSKADLKSGKVPIDQLPDSVAYGGLSFVGMWSFEDHDGEYPTLLDVDFSVMSDDEYTELQRGWFFIVKASNKEDDPCYPQTATDGVEYTAGDWIVYEGKNKDATKENAVTTPLQYLKPVVTTSHTLLQYKENSNYTAVWSSGQQYSTNTKTGLSTLAFFADKVDLYKSTDDGFNFVESYSVEYVEGLFDKASPDVTSYTTVTQIKIGEYTFNVNGTAVRSDNTDYSVLDTQYIYKADWLSGNTGHIARLLLEPVDDASKAWAVETFAATDDGFCLRPTMISGWYGSTTYSSTSVLDDIDYTYSQQVRAYGNTTYEIENIWDKVDRSYSDPVYSRLPELAPVTDGENVQWSVDDGGTGLLNLSYKTLAEALRLLNQELLSAQPDRPTEISKVYTVLDEANTTAELYNYVKIPNNGQLNQILETTVTSGYKTGSGVVAFKQSSPSGLPLETCFYSGSSSDIGAVDGTDTISTITVDTFDPYERWRLGFQSPSGVTGTLVTGTVEMNSESTTEHSIAVTQYNIVKHARFTDEASSILEGQTHTFDFEEQRQYNLEDLVVNKCVDSGVNLEALNKLLENNSVAGLGYIPAGNQVTGSFVLDNFAKYNMLNTNANVELKAMLGDEECPITIESQLLTLTDSATGTYSLTVHFSTTPISEKLETRQSFIVLVKVTNGSESDFTEVLNIPLYRLAKDVPTIVESGNGLYPTLGTTSDTTLFGATYVNKTNAKGWQELTWTENGFGYPSDDYIASWTTTDNYTLENDTSTDYTEYDSEQYKFVTFKYSLESIYDLTGFDLILDWGIEPTLNTQTGLYENVLLQVCVDSSELSSHALWNANSPVAVFQEVSYENDNACLYSGLSDMKTRHISFGRTTVPVKDIYIRVGLTKDSALKGISISC